MKKESRRWIEVVFNCIYQYFKRLDLVFATGSNWRNIILYKKMTMEGDIFFIRVSFIIGIIVDYFCIFLVSKNK